MDEKKLIEAIEHYTGEKFDPTPMTEEEEKRQWNLFVEHLKTVSQSNTTENFATPIEKY